LVETPELRLLTAIKDVVSEHKFVIQQLENYITGWSL